MFLGFFKESDYKDKDGILRWINISILSRHFQGGKRKKGIVLKGRDKEKRKKKKSKNVDQSKSLPGSVNL